APAPLRERPQGHGIEPGSDPERWPLHLRRAFVRGLTPGQPAAAGTRGEERLEVGFDPVAAQPEAGLAVDGEPHQADLERARGELVDRAAVAARPGIGAGGRDHAGTVAERKLRTAVVKAYGASSIGMCPTPGSTS